MIVVASEKKTTFTEVRLLVSVETEKNLFRYKKFSSLVAVNLFARQFSKRIGEAFLELLTENDSNKSIL